MPAALQSPGVARGVKLPESCRTIPRHKSRKVTLPASPASSRELRSCPKAAPKQSKSCCVSQGPVQIRPNLVPNWPKPGHPLANFDQHGPTLAQSVGQFRPALAHFGPNSAKRGLAWCFQVWPTFDMCWPNSDQSAAPGATFPGFPGRISAIQGRRHHESMGSRVATRNGRSAALGSNGRRHRPNVRALDETKRRSTDPPESGPVLGGACGAYPVLRNLRSTVIIVAPHRVAQIWPTSDQFGPCSAQA